MDWLRRHQPRVAASLEAPAHELQDFAFLRHFSLRLRSRCSRGDRWALTGEAGVFLDPFYSPGSDFIAISNTYICRADRRGPRAASPSRAMATLYEQLYFSFYENTLTLYRGPVPAVRRCAGHAAEGDLGLHVLLGAARAAVLLRPPRPRTGAGRAARAVRARGTRSTSACRRCCATGARATARGRAHAGRGRSPARPVPHRLVPRAQPRSSTIARSPTRSWRAPRATWSGCSTWPRNCWRVARGQYPDLDDGGLDRLLAGRRAPVEPLLPPEWYARAVPGVARAA